MRVKGKKVGYRINSNSPDCGRDKNGVFICVCGKCEALMIDDSHNCGNDGRNSCNDADCCVDDKTP